MPAFQTHHNHTKQGPTTNINVGSNERWASVGSGLLLTLLGFRLRGWKGLGVGVGGSALLLRGATGVSALYKLLDVNRALVSETAAASVPHNQGIRVEESVTIYNRTPDELYQVWRNVERLPEFMENLKSVTVLSPTRSRWVVNAPLGRTIEWDAEIVNEVENERIGWRTLHNARVSHAGSVQFKSAPADRGTEVHVQMEYAPPAGPLGALVAKMLGKEPQQQVAADLYRFKQLMEVGEIATVDGQSSGRSQRDSEAPVPNYRKYESSPKDIVQEASEQSFPASDPPGYY